MENNKKKNKNQIMLFKRIEKDLPANHNLAHVISEFLEIGYAAAYSRIRGDKPISFEETVKLCNYFNISVDSVVGITDKNHIHCRYTPLDLTDMTDFLTFVQVASKNLEDTKLAPEGEIIMSAVDVPIFNILPYKELTSFKLFSWSKSIYNFMGDYETFVKESRNIESLNQIYENILNNYQLVPSTEIWTNSTIDTVLRLLNYHFEMRHFSDKKSLSFLCEQLLGLISTLQDWAKKGTKGEKGASFKFYVSETGLENQFVLFKSEKTSNCMVKLYTINGLGISDERFCSETERWLQRLIQRSILISVASEIERNKFFDTQKGKIEEFIEKIQSSF